MVDTPRVATKVAELEQYLTELSGIVPKRFSQYQAVEKKRSCERLLQLSIECVIDVCKLLTIGLRLGVPAQENDLFDKLLKSGVFDRKTVAVLKKMRALRNILVHEYAEIKDELVFEIVVKRRKEFGMVIKKVKRYLQANPR